MKELNKLVFYDHIPIVNKNNPDIKQFLFSLYRCIQYQGEYWFQNSEQGPDDSDLENDLSQENQEQSYEKINQIPNNIGDFVFGTYFLFLMIFSE